MRKILALTLVLAAQTAFAQDIGMYNRALSSFNAGEFDQAARTFWELTETSTDQDIRARSEYYLAQSLAKKNLPFAAYIYYYSILRSGPQHPFYLRAVEGLVNVQRELNDQYLIPNTLNREYNEQWATLPLEVLARINYMIGIIEHRRARFEEARDFLAAVPKETSIYAKSRYLLGIVYVDPRFPGGPQFKEGLDAFAEVMNLSGDKYEGLTETKQLATLATGRTYYGMGEYQNSVNAYEKVPRFSRYWDQALFENGFARFQNEDFGGALGSLQALHAPQFAGAFQPESWILKATVFYFSCLYEESKAALAAFDERYLPMAETIRKLMEGEEERDVSYFYELIASPESSKLPRPVLLWVRGNERMLGLFGMLAQIDKEKAAIAANTAWQGAKMGGDITTYLDQNRGTLTQIAGTVARNRLQEAAQNIRTYSDASEIIRFETTKSEKELFEGGIDQSRILNAQTLYRPRVPAENWNYWRFQGEFWIDEIGYYQYTLKRGCPEAEQ